MMVDPFTLVEVRERKTREFNPGTGLLAGEVAEFRRPVRWGFLIITATQAVVVFGVVGLAWSVLS